MKQKIMLLVSILVLSVFIFAEDIKLVDAASVDAVIKAMTLEEKASLVFGVGSGAVLRVNGVAGGTYKIDRLGIPEIDVADGPVGLRIGGSTGGVPRTTTAFPIPTAMAATWDLKVMETIGKVMGNEVKEYGVDILLGPALNIQRDPLGGRNFEYYTEDPFLNGKLTTAFVIGLQSNGVGATLKHFAANNTETYRMGVNQLISERALREIYLPGFEMAVKEGKPWAVMSAYPGINGAIAAQNKYLLTDILRTEWGFDGLVMSDWGAVKDPVAGLKAGNNLAMPRPNTKAVIEAVKNGILDEKILDENVKNILLTILKTPTFKGYKGSDNPDKKSVIPFLRQLGAESMVLLKNEGTALPISTKKKVALFGKNAYDFIIGGGGSAAVNSEYKVQLQEGLENAGYKLIKDSKVFIEGISAKDIAAAVKNSDVAVISIGRFSSEGADKYTMNMDPEEIQMIKDVSEAYHKAKKQVVVLLNIGAPLEMASWVKYADSILITWQPGQEAGNAVADVLTGKVNPSGKLPETFPVRYEDSPSFGNFPAMPNFLYGEGILVGYRYYDTKGVAPLYPFGYGLSYTTFEVKNLKVSSTEINLDSDVNLTVTVDVKNTGKVKGKEVVQIYVQDTASTLMRPEKELKGFEKVELNPGETKTLTFVLDKRAFSFYDDTKKKWAAESGYFSIKAGSSSRNITTEAKIKGVGGEQITLETKWPVIQSSQKLSKVVAKYIGGKNMNEWYLFSAPGELLGGVLKVNFEMLNPTLKGNVEKLKEFTDKVLAELNAQ